jgi:hypothetical protein
MCRKAQGWKCQEAVTNFLSTVLFSIVKGEDCDYVDTLQLSDCELFKVRTEGKPKCDRKGTTAEAGVIGRKFLSHQFSFLEPPIFLDLKMNLPATSLKPAFLSHQCLSALSRTTKPW